MKQKDVDYRREDVVFGFAVGTVFGMCAFAVGMVLLLQFMQAVTQ